MANDSEWSITDLLAMDEREARETLPVAQYERWEKLQALDEEGRETKAQWEDERETVHDVVVNADIEQLGTRVDLYGNDLLVHINPDDRHFQNELDALESDFDELENLDREAIEHEQRQDDLVKHIAGLYDAILVEWNGESWGSLDESNREAILADSREAWGTVAFVLGIVKCVRAWRAEQNNLLDVVDSFRGEGGGGDN